MKYCYWYWVLAPLCLFSYEVNIVGLSDEAALKAMFDVSDLVVLQDRPPASINGLRYRIAGDIPELLKVLRAYGYYDASITSDVEIKKETVQVTLFIHSGPQYRLFSYEIFHGDCAAPQAAAIPCCEPFIPDSATNLEFEGHHSGSDLNDCSSEILMQYPSRHNPSNLSHSEPPKFQVGGRVRYTPEMLGLQIDAPALWVDIVNAELNLLTQLSRCGYPLASVEKRRVVADMQKKIVEAAVCIEEGPICKFGPLSISGLKTVEPRYVLRRIAWKEGFIYNTDALEETQKRLLDSDLFSSVLISHEEKLDQMGELPMKMRISEAKHRQVSIGVFYATVDGPGANFSWTHRNLRGMGETISIVGEASLRYFSGTVTYKKPDFLSAQQTYRALAEIEREQIHAYTALTYRAANFIDRKFGPRKNISVGLEVEQINVSNSASNGKYSLIAMPFFARYNRSDDLLNPTRGYTLVYQPHFFQSLEHGHRHFLKQRFTASFYIPAGTKRLVFAFRTQFGSVAGARQKFVPLPLLFIGGSEDDLRGYRYLTVSPLNQHRKPFGGRSAVFLTTEMRIRFTEAIGIVPFADFGTVTRSELPTFEAKWFKSIGIGLRYFTFFGPLRADIGFPLDRRKGVDPSFRIYASIGQTF